LKSRFTS